MPFKSVKVFLKKNEQKKKKKTTMKIEEEIFFQESYTLVPSV